jgi:hypothetical protein
MRWFSLLALPAILLAGCSTLGGWKLPWARSCDDRPTDFERHLACPLGGKFEIVRRERHPCTEGGGAFGSVRQRHLADEHTMDVEREGSDETFARIRIEQSVPVRFSHHKHNLMDNLHAMSASTVPGTDVNGIPTFWVDDSSAVKPGDVETIRVLFDDDRRAIVTVYFLRTEIGERPRGLQDAFVDAFTRCFTAG